MLALDTKLISRIYRNEHFEINIYINTIVGDVGKNICNACSTGIDNFNKHMSFFCFVFLVMNLT